MAWEHLERGSSPVDWCEGNYQISANIAEFVNTFSNLIFVLLPPIQMHLFKQYGNFVNPGIHLIWFLLIVVGVSSAYFHATLSLIGQLLDELAILWVCAAAFSMFHPKRFYPKFLNGNRKHFSTIIGFLAIICTALSIWQPAINAFVLMLLIIPATWLLYKELKEVTDVRVYRLGIRCTAVLCLAIFCWITDRFYCDATWWGRNFPYLHGFWHIFIFISSYTACVLFAYFSVKHEMPEHTPDLKYWPINEFELGVPYVTIKCYYNKIMKDHI